VHWNRNGDLSHRVGFCAVLDVRLYEFRCHHWYCSPLYGAKAIPEYFNCQLIFVMKSIPSPERPVSSTRFEDVMSLAKINFGSRLNIQRICFAHLKKKPKTS
jgi:hypothetical protein